MRRLTMLGPLAGLGFVLTAGLANAQPDAPPDAPIPPDAPPPSDAPPVDATPVPPTDAVGPGAPTVAPAPAPAPPPGPVATQPAPPPPTPPASAAPASSGGFFSAYTTWYDGWLETIFAKPLWGNSAQLPEGVLKLRYKYGHPKAGGFFGRDGEELPLLPPISLTQCDPADPTAPCDVTVIDPKVTGGAHTHDFQIAYGITDPWDVWVEIPFQNIDSTLDLGITKNGQPAGAVTAAGLEAYLAANGRPLPNDRFAGDTDLGDIRVGTSWNYFRTNYFSTAVTPSVYLPTGHPADPNNDLTFLRGSEIDRGMGAWAVSLVNTFDVRPVEWFTLNFEASTSYRFGYDRDTPKWLPITDCLRIQDPARRTELACPATRPYDKAYDLEQSATFPNLEGLDDTYYVYPNMSMSFAAGFSLDIFHIPLQFGWQFTRNEAVAIKATGAGDSGPAFEQLVRSLALLEATELHAISIGLQLPLLPLYIPVIITPTYQRALAGRNTIRLENQFSIAFDLFLPVGEAF